MKKFYFVYYSINKRKSKFLNRDFLAFYRDFFARFFKRLGESFLLVLLTGIF